MGIAANRKEQTLRALLGTGDYYGTRASVTAKAEFRRGPVDVAPYLDWNLNPIETYTEVHIGFEVCKTSTGELVAWLHDGRELAPHFPEAADMLRRLSELGDRAKNTGTVAGTEAQLALLDQHEAELKAAGGDYYETACNLLKAAGLYEVGNWRGSSNKEEPKPYRYGCAWLVRSVPADLEQAIIDTMREARDHAPAKPQDFASSVGLTMEAEPAPSNPHMEDMVAGSRHFLCTLTAKSGAKMRLHYSVGPAIAEGWAAEQQQARTFRKGSEQHRRIVARLVEQYRPAINDVLSCLANDAMSIENAPLFEDWAAEFGYDVDSRKAKKIWETVSAQRHQLERLLGREAYNSLING